MHDIDQLINNDKTRKKQRTTTVYSGEFSCNKQLAERGQKKAMGFLLSPFLGLPQQSRLGDSTYSYFDFCPQNGGGCSAVQCSAVRKRKTREKKNRTRRGILFPRATNSFCLCVCRARTPLVRRNSARKLTPAPCDTCQVIRTLEELTNSSSSSSSSSSYRGREKERRNNRPRF